MTLLSNVLICNASLFPLLPTITKQERITATNKESIHTLFVNKNTETHYNAYVPNSLLTNDSLKNGKNVIAIYFY